MLSKPVDQIDLNNNITAEPSFAPIDDAVESIPISKPVFVQKNSLAVATGTDRAEKKMKNTDQKELEGFSRKPPKQTGTIPKSQLNKTTISSITGPSLLIVQM